MKLAMKFRYLIVLSVALCAVLATRSWADTQMIRIPGGSFMMGSNSSLVDECPSHKVTVKTFYLNKTAVS